MRQAASSPVRQLGALVAFALAVVAVPLLHTGALEAGAARGPLSWAPAADPLAPVVARADTDSVAIGRDTLVADTTDADSTARASYLLPALPRENFYAVPIERLVPSILGGRIRARQQQVLLDSTGLFYTARESIGNTEIRTPVEFTLSEYLEAQRTVNIADGFRQLANTRIQRQQRRAGVGFNIDIPGGNQSAFTTIFGKNEVDLRVTGNSTLDLGAGYDQNALQQARTGNDGSFAPDFGQELNLNVAGTIGDKLRINVNYDTQSQFDFENQVSLVYTGYEDDIVQKIEAGNVFLQTPSELIRGGQRLFGLRTDLQFGPLSVTGVASQQDAESEEVVIEGGSQSTPIDLAPYRYEDNTHFFLGFNFYNWWDNAHRDPSNPTIPPGLTRITGLEVWVQDAQANNPTTSNDENIFATALVDLGEPIDVLQGGRAYLDQVGPEAQLPNPEIDQYSTAEITRLRTQNDAISYTDEFGLSENDYQSGRWRKLNSGTDYKFDENLGWLSLTGSLGPDDAIAVAYQYRTSAGQTVTIGDFAQPSQTSENRTILKLLRDDAPVAEAAAWDLTMRNIYRVGGRSLNASDFTLRITYEQPGNTPQENLPGIQVSDGFSLLQSFGLDRTDQSGLPRPDNEFDFRLGYTVDAQSGRIIFPVREPFGRYLEGLLRDGLYVSGETVGISVAGGYESVAADVVFPRLYEVKPEVASRELNKLNRYRIAGEYRSASQSVFNVGFGVVEGSVTVTSGGVTLIEGQDYIVNETQGTVEIQNPLYLAPGQQVRVQVERNQLFSIGSKTLIGLRSDYRISEKAGFGATWMRLSERPLVDKFRIGEEALRNTVFGVDGGFTYEPRWITRALDALPLIQTRAPSSFEVRGEFAQFSPGHPETFAFREVQRNLASLDRSLADDELDGISSIDDFEGAENVNSALEQAPGWRIAAPPRGSGPMNGQGTVRYERDVTPINDPRLATSWRGLFGWYAIAGQAYQTLEDLVGSLPRAAQPVLPNELYPGRDFAPTERSQPLTLLDLYFDPNRRGPYNYNRELGSTFANDPASAWGGMIRSLDAAYSDFDGANTVESIEFLFAPLGGRDGDQEIAPGAVLHIDLGSLNEETIPNGVLNSEDGLSETPEASVIDEWSRRTDALPNSNVDVYEATGRTEDLGLDGLPSRRTLVASGGDPYPLAEGDLPGVAEFLSALPSGAEQLRAQDDPAGDDYHHFRDTYFNDNGLFPGGASAQERYAHYYSGSELNNDIARRAILPDQENGISQIPSSEDVNENFNSTKLEEEQFYRYSLPLDEAGLRASPYFTGSTIDAAGATWYLVRIPVRNPTANEGGNLSNVEMVRVWTEGHIRPATMRFATFELVGSQWQKSEQVGILDADGGVGATELFIASINTDENPQQYLPPVSALRPVSRDFSGATRDAREQSLVMRIEDLGEGEFRGLYKPFTTKRLDLTKYSNVRMFVHGEGFETRDSVRVFMRLGSDETENYYEIEQPLYPAQSDNLAEAFDLGSVTGRAQAADYLWQTRSCPGGDDPDGDGPLAPTACADGEKLDLNSINILLSELNKLKVSRDASGAPINERYTEDRRPEGAAPGARISIVGTPSIQSVSTVVIGIRNGESGDAVPLDELEIWFNELRVTGYDEGGGSSAFVSAQARLADVVSANARVSLSQDGFGGLSGGLGERDFVDRIGYTVSSTFNAHKLLPERYGWSAPVQVSITENQSSPRFDPTNSDIRIEDLADQVLSDETIPVPERAIIADSIRAAAQTVTSQRTIRVPLNKTGSRSPWLKYTLDALALSYTNTTQSGRSPRQVINGSDSWAVDASYRLTVPRPRTVRPFWFTSGVPLVGSALENLRMNLLPRSLTFSANTGRSVTESRERPRSSDLDQPEIVNEFLYPRRVTHDFGHRRSFNLQYELFPFLTTSYGANSTQSLDLAGVDERFRLLARDTSGVFGEVGRIEEFSISREDALQPGSELWQRFGITSQEELAQLQILGGTTTQLDVVPWSETIGATLGGYRRLLTDRYDQQFSTSLRISTRNVKWLAWIQPRPISVASTYAWDYQPVTGFEDQTIAGVGSSVQLQTGLRFKPRDFWRLFPFYRGLEEDDRAARQASDQRRRERDAERQRRRDERERARELEEIGEVDLMAEDDEPEVVDAETPEASGAEAEDDGRGPLINFGGIGRRLFLAVTGIEDLEVTYRGAFTSSANGIVGEGFSLLAAATGNAPPLGYRIGLDRRLPLGSRLSDPQATLQLQDVLGDDHQVEGRTTFQPTQDLRISLTATTSWDQNDTYPIERTPDALIEQDPIRRGSSQSTVLGIGGTYEGLIDLHRQRLEADVAAGSNGSGFVESAAGSASGLADDFNATFANGIGRFGPDGLFTLPIPSWEVNWTGLSRWPLFNRLTQQVTVQHSYYASNQAEYNSLDALGDRTRTIGTFDLVAPLTDVEPQALVVNERFQPVIGVRVGWKGGLQTEITHNRSRVLTLQPGSASLTQKNVSDVQGNISYSKTGFRLPFMSRLRNTIRFTLTASVTDDQTRVRSIVSDLENVLSGGEISEPQGNQFKRISVWPRVGYQISNRVNMDVFFRYERSLTAGTTGSPSIATYDGGVTLRISFSN